MNKAERLEKFTEGLNPLFKKRVYKLFELLDDKWAPYCGIRTFKEQQKLYDQGRVVSGPIVTYARAGRSYHNYGLAIDSAWFVRGKNPWGDAPWQEFLDAVDKIDGIERGPKWDKPHVQMSTALSLDDIEGLYKSGGLPHLWGEIEKGKTWKTNRQLNHFTHQRDFTYTLSALWRLLCQALLSFWRRIFRSLHLLG
jgi:peptidoglycan L-alanyl-D-glutamate endopeptidase CwlK